MARNKLYELPKEIGQLPKLMELTFYHNQVKQLPPEISQLTSLREIGVRGNPISHQQVNDLVPEFCKVYF